MTTHSNNHATPPGPSGPRPTPICVAYAPLLPLLKNNELTPEQAVATREHLAGCAWCRTRLASYDTLYAALRQRFDPDVVAAGVRVPSMREIAELSAASSDGALGRSSGGPRLRLPERDGGENGEGMRFRTGGRITRLRLPIRFEAVAALLLVTLLGGFLVMLRSGWLGGPPPLTAQERAYVTVLRADYLPLLDAIGADSRQCVTAFDKAPAADKPQNMLDCRPVQVTALARSQTLLNDLQATQAPPRWQTADAQLKAWTQAQIAFYTNRIQAIDTRDVQRFTTLGDQGAGSTDSCPAIAEINASLPSDNQLPANALGYCGG